MRSILFIALAAIIGFSMAGCDNGSTSTSTNDDNNNNGNNNNNNNQTPGFSVSGKFSKSASEEVKFTLAETTVSAPVSSVQRARSARAVVESAEKTISGKIEDGDFTIKLSGTYNAETGSYTASAAASIIRYTINGAIDEKGESLGSTATLLVKNGDDWTATSYVITEAPITISGNAVESTPGGLPAFARGLWKYSRFEDKGDQYKYTYEYTFMVNPWDIDFYVGVIDHAEDNIYVKTSNKSNVVEIENSGSTYNVIVAYPVYTATEAQVIASVREYFSSRGITLIQTDDQLTGLNDSNPRFFVKKADYSDVYTPYFYNLSDEQWNIANGYYGSNALKRYLIAQNVASSGTLFEKHKFVFSDNNTKMAWSQYADMMASACETLAEAKALTWYEENAVVLTREAPPANNNNGNNNNGNNNGNSSGNNNNNNQNTEWYYISYGYPMRWNLHLPDGCEEELEYLYDLKMLEKMRPAIDTYLTTQGYTKLTDAQAQFVYSYGNNQPTYIPQEDGNAIPTKWYYINLSAPYGSTLNFNILKYSIDAGTVSATENTSVTLNGISIANPRKIVYLSNNDINTGIDFMNKFNSGVWHLTRDEEEAIIAKYCSDNGITAQKR